MRRWGEPPEGGRLGPRCCGREPVPEASRGVPGCWCHGDRHRPVCPRSRDPARLVGGVRPRSERGVGAAPPGRCRRPIPRGAGARILQQRPRRAGSRRRGPRRCARCDRGGVRRGRSDRLRRLGARERRRDARRRRAARVPAGGVDARDGVGARRCPPAAAGDRRGAGAVAGVPPARRPARRPARIGRSGRLPRRRGAHGRRGRRGRDRPRRRRRLRHLQRRHPGARAPARARHRRDHGTRARRAVARVRDGEPAVDADGRARVRRGRLPRSRPLPRVLAGATSPGARSARAIRAWRTAGRRA